MLFGVVVLAVGGAGRVIADPTVAVSTTAVAVASSGQITITKDSLYITHPAEESNLGEIRSTFVCGYADPHGSLSLNGTPVKVEPYGGFMAMVPLQPGNFVIRADLMFPTTSCSLIRHVQVENPPAPLPVKPLVIGRVWPDTQVELLPDDDVSVGCTASPGMKAYATVTGASRKIPLVETDSGTYRGTLVILPSDHFKKARVKAVVSARNGKSISKISAGDITTFSMKTPFMVAVSSPNTALRAGPRLSVEDKAGIMIHAPLGTILRVTGQRENEYRVHLSKTRDAWVSLAEVSPLPAGTPIPRAAVGTVTVTGDEKATEVSVYLGKKVPFEILPDISGNYLDINIFGAYSNTDWIHYLSSGTIIEQLKWYQDDTDTYRLRVQTKPGSFWGYDARYENGSFVLEALAAPKMDKATDALPLAGLRIAVDAGHSPGTGAVGCTGVIERDVNILIAKDLAQILCAKGATVIMTREGNEEVGLYERPEIAWRNRANILISCHNNALGDGGNPLINNGYGVYYANSWSFGLAREIHAAYGETIGAKSSLTPPLNDDGLHYGNLVLPRTTEMLSVLTESAYMIVPHEEYLLTTDKFRNQCAQAMATGIERYVKKLRPVVKKEKN
jgi:N-acetylmuramoyl-L-alanine amidase